MTRSRLLALAGCLSALAFVALGQAQSPVPDADRQALAEHEIKYLKEELAKAKILKKASGRIRMAAFVLAAASDGDLRGNALKIMEAMEKGDKEQAKKIADGLSAKGAAKAGAGSLAKHLDLDLLMRMYSSERVGGFGLEMALDGLAEAKGLSKEQAAEAAHLGLKAAFISHLTEWYAPAKDAGDKTKAAWLKFSAQTRQAALDLAKAARSGGNVAEASRKVTSACIACHDVFR